MRHGFPPRRKLRAHLRAGRACEQKSLKNAPKLVNKYNFDDWNTFFMSFKDSSPNNFDNLQAGQCNFFFFFFSQFFVSIPILIQFLEICVLYIFLFFFFFFFSQFFVRIPLLIQFLEICVLYIFLFFFCFYQSNLCLQPPEPFIISGSSHLNIFH